MPQSGVRRRAQFDHPQAVCVVGFGKTALMRWMPGGDEQDLVYMKAVGGRARRRQVTAVNRIESPAEDRRAHRVSSVSDLSDVSDVSAAARASRRLSAIQAPK